MAIYISQPGAAEGKDAMCKEDNGGSNYGGATTWETGQNTPWRDRTAIEFDLSSIDYVSVTSANLQVYSYSAGTEASSLHAYNITSSWTEMGITWNTMPNIGSSMGSVGKGTGWLTIPLNAAMVENMIDSNNGMMLINLPENSNFKWVRGYTSDYSSSRPKLTIVYVEKGNVRSTFFFSLAGLAIPAAMGQIVIPTAMEIAKLT